MARKVVITGLGATTPIGGDVPTMWQNALKGVSGAHTLDDVRTAATVDRLLLHAPSHPSQRPDPSGTSLA